MPQFDAYHVWLGIPPYDQPPNHYRLLGLEAFEDNQDAIANSADRQMAHIRSVSAAENTDRAQQLLSEISAARVVLLNEARKKAYDTKLRSDFGQYDLSGDVPLSNAVDDLAQSDVRGREALLNHARNELRNEKNQQDEQQINYIYAIGGVLAVLVALAIAIPIVWSLGGGEEPNQGGEVAQQGGESTGAQSGTNGAGSQGNGAQGNGAPTKAGAGGGVIVGTPQAPDGSAATAKSGAKEKNSTKPVTPSAPGLTPGLPGGAGIPAIPPGAGFNPGAPLGGSPGLSQGGRIKAGGVGGIGSKPPATGTSDPPKLDPKALAERDAILRLAQKRRGGFIPPATPTIARPQPAKSKTPIPTAADFATGEEEVKAVYKAEFAKVRTPVERAQLANFLYRQIQTVGDDAKSKYVLLKMAQDLAVNSGQARLAFDCLKQMEINFEIDVVDARRQLVLRLASRKSMPNDQRKSLVSTALQNYKELKELKRYDEALEIAQAARSQALNAKDATLRVQAQTIFAESNSMARMKKDHDSALKKLVAAVDDPVANREVGLYLCLIAEDWDKGLPHLTKAKSNLLATAAKQDLTNPQMAAEMVELGDAWNAAAALKGNELFRSRAMHWYTKAAPDLTGLARSSLDREMREIRDAGP